MKRTPIPINERDGERKRLFGYKNRDAGNAMGFLFQENKKTHQKVHWIDEKQNQVKSMQ